jgi:sensor histidine kinase YesM
MNVKTFTKIPLLPLGLLCLTYTLLGWYLSAHHIVWLVGAFIIFFALAVGWNKSHWLEQLVKFISRELVTVLILSLVVSILVALATTWSILLSLVLLPLATVFLAEVELGFAGFSKLNTFLMVTILAGFSLGLGEIIDILFFPSMRF